MKKTIYIETTIPSFHYEIRPEPEMVARKQWTKEWWDNQRHHYDLVTSIFVIEELKSGDHPNKEKALDLISELPVLPIEDFIYEIVETYISTK
jgi:hypothetical protein